MINPITSPLPASQLSPQDQAIRAGTTQPLRDLQLQSGDSAAVLAQGRTQSSTVGGSVPPSQSFGNAIQQLLLQYQQLGTKPFVEQGFNAQTAQNSAVLAQTSPDLIGANPGLQNSVRSGQASSFGPTIQGANQGMQTFSEQIHSFGDAIQNVQQLMRDQEAQQQQLRDNMRQSVLDAAALGGSQGLQALLKSNPEAFKVSGFDPETLIASIKSQEDAAAKQLSFENNLKKMAATPHYAATEGDKDLSEIRRLDSVLNASRQGGQYVDGNVYQSQKRTSRLSAQDFDARFGNLLSPSDQSKYGVSSSGVTKTPAQQSELLNNLNLTNQILSSNLKPVTGLLQLRSHIPGTAAQYTSSQIKQLQGLLSLDNRTKLKGSGAISDFESKTLSEAASALNRNLSETDFRRELARIRGVFATASGQSVTVKVTDPRTGESKIGDLDGKTIEEAIGAGYQIEYQ